jgi:hypothetical protein
VLDEYEGDVDDSREQAREEAPTLLALINDGRSAETPMRRVTYRAGLGLQSAAVSRSAGCALNQRLSDLSC